MTTPPPGNWRCSGHEAMAREVTTVLQVAKELRGDLKEYQRSAEKNGAKLDTAIAGLVQANGVKGERLAVVEVKTSWLAALFGAAGGIIIQIALWIWKGSS